MEINCDFEIYHVSAGNSSSDTRKASTRTGRTSEETWSPLVKDGGLTCSMKVQLKSHAQDTRSDNT